VVRFDQTPEELMPRDKDYGDDSDAEDKQRDREEQERQEREREDREDRWNNPDKSEDERMIRR
jgi:hypothetical protein